MDHRKAHLCGSFYSPSIIISYLRRNLDRASVLVVIRLTTNHHVLGEARNLLNLRARLGTLWKRQIVADILWLANEGWRLKLTFRIECDAGLSGAWLWLVIN
jgi:hypothetical protein